MPKYVMRVFVDINGAFGRLIFEGVRIEMSENVLLVIGNYVFVLGTLVRLDRSVTEDILKPA